MCLEWLIACVCSCIQKIVCKCIKNRLFSNNHNTTNNGLPPNHRIVSYDPEHEGLISTIDDMGHSISDSDDSTDFDTTMRETLNTTVFKSCMSSSSPICISKKILEEPEYVNDLSSSSDENAML